MRILLSELVESLESRLVVDSEFLLLDLLREEKSFVMDLKELSVSLCKLECVEPISN